MAYEDMEYEVILDRMLDRVLETYPNIDTREGSLIYNALAPAALELAIMYTELDNVLNESFVATASREYLIKKCEEVGIDPTIFDATYGEFEAHFNVEIPINSRWNCDTYNYEVISYIGESTTESDEYVETIYKYRLKCETEGTSPNTLLGDLTPIDFVPVGLYYAKLEECLVYGENEADDERVREAYINKVKNVNNNGNLAQYGIWCEEFRGKFGSIGNYNIIPRMEGVPNTINIFILNSENEVASSELINEVQTYFDPLNDNGKPTGMGNGVAPVGAIVKVETGDRYYLGVSATITFEEGYNDTSAIEKAITEYFKEITFKQDRISYMQLGATILNVEGVASITNLKLNGSPGDFILGGRMIPLLGPTEWVVD